MNDNSPTSKQVANHNDDSTAADLRERISGEIRFDDYSRQLYATDASIYEVTPTGVVFPNSTDDVSTVVTYCAEHDIPVLPRGGGTSLAGQAVNEAIVLDLTRYMDGVVDINPASQRAHVQPGITLGHLNSLLVDHGLKFAPDPAWGDKSVVGGAIGNNSTGAHSLQYGKTDAYIETCEVVLADGTVTCFGEMTVADLRDDADIEGDLEQRIYAEVLGILEGKAVEINARYPELKRNVSGYNLDRLVNEATDANGDIRDEASFNLARLLAGSEGTLAVVTEAELSLKQVPETKGVTLLVYKDLVAAMEDVEHILKHDPAAVEVLDDVLLDLARETAEFSDVVDLVPEETGAALLVEFYAESDAEGREKVAGLLVDRVPSASPEGTPTEQPVNTDSPVYAFNALEAHEKSARERFWKLRKSGLPILLSRTTDEKHIAFIEDTAVPPPRLPEFVQEFQVILARHDTFASFYAHAGPGVLHIRPLLNTKSVEGIETMEAIADEVTDLVVEYGGSISGEHGDGRARTQWNRKLYGEDIWETFRSLKSTFDPDWLLNPGQVVSCEESPTRLTENLRFSPDYKFEAGFETTLNWDIDNGMQGMVELCHGCGGCRGDQHTTGGVMCPTYRAADEEITATRGRANMLRQAMSGDLPDDPTTPKFMSEVLDLCIGCKGCARDCPSEVDMAKLKAEVTHAAHQEHGASFRSRIFANVDTLARIGSATAPLSNSIMAIPGARRVLERVVGIAKERPLPTFKRETFSDWFENRGPVVSADEATRKALFFPDTYTNYSNPDIGKAAIRVLEAAGVHVQVIERTDSGRQAFSKGFLDQARETARSNAQLIAPWVEDGWDVVIVEPSDAVMFQWDYLDLLSGEHVEAVAEHSYGICEYLDIHDLDMNVNWTTPNKSLIYHGHCHQKAAKKDHHAVGVLRRAGYTVEPLDSGCCGMAGSFGYEAEHVTLSKAIGDILFNQIEASELETVVAPGESCRTQLDDWDGTDAKPPHPIELLADAISVDT